MTSENKRRETEGYLCPLCLKSGYCVCDQGQADASLCAHGRNPHDCDIAGCMEPFIEEPQQKSTEIKSDLSKNYDHEV